MLSASSCCRCVSLTVAASFALIGCESLCSASSAAVVKLNTTLILAEDGCVHLRSIGRCWAAVQAALFLIVALPPPTPGALRLTWFDRARARRAADREEAAIVQRIVGNAVRTQEID